MQKRYVTLNTKKQNKDEVPVSRIQYITIMLLVVISLYFFFQSPFFEVNKIYVVGTDKLTINQVLDLARVQPGYNILQVRTKEVESRLETSPWIRESTVERNLPSTVRITIVEREATAIAQTVDGFLIIDDTGVVLRKVENLAEVVLPVITGISLTEQFLVGDQVPNQKINIALNVISELPPAIKQRSSEVSLEEGITVFFAGGLEIKIGSEENLSEKLQTLTEIFTNTDEEVLEQIKYIDLRFNGPPIIKYGR